MKTVSNIIKLILAFTVLFLVSCNETPKSAESENINSIIKDVTGQNADKEKDYTQLFEELIAKKPLSVEQLTEAFPKKIGNFNLDGPPSMGIDQIDAATQVIIGNFGEGAIKLEISDAVGNMAGLAVSHLKSYDLINYESDDNTKYVKKERNGIKTSGVYIVGENESELKFLFDNRFYVSIEAKEMDLDKLWELFGIQNLQRFKDFNK